MSPDALTLTTYALLLVSVIALWTPWRFAWIVPLIASIVLGYASGVLSGFAIAPLLVLAVACWSFHRTRASPLVRVGFAVVVIIVALGLGLHAFPGFANAVLLRNATATLALNFDKTIVGVLILGLCYEGRISAWAEWTRMLRRAAPIIVLNIVIVIALALAIGYVRFDPKWTALFWPWAVVNLFFTCVAEEAFFRGLIQRQLERVLTFRYKEVVAIAVSAILFGIAHVAGGMLYALLATVAGVGYALAFQRTHRIEASILAHFLLNATHFLLLTYPRVG